MTITDSEPSGRLDHVHALALADDASLAGLPLPTSPGIPPETPFQPQGSNARRLREARLDELIGSCREQVLQQIIGPFGLTPAMFDDKTGGNVTTQHNAEQGIFAKDSEHYKRAEYDYAKAKKEKMAESVKNQEMNSQQFTDAYTGKQEPTRKLNANGKQVMNAELDHTVSMKEAHGQGGWMMDAAGRKAVSSEKDNLNYTTQKTNRQKRAEQPETFLNEENQFDESITKPIVDKARKAVEQHMPTTGERLRYHGKELLGTGAREAGKNALRQAMGVLMFEFANGSYVEIARLVKQSDQEASLIDRIVQAMHRVTQRVVAKTRAAFDAAVQGGVQGFVGNLLTFIINNVVTTSAKVVTIIREGIKGIWAAVKMVVSPPPGTSGADVARAATKLIAGVVTTSLGMIFEQSVRGFLVSIPLFVPVADLLAPVVTGILTGLMTSLVVFGIDRLFDAIADKGTEHLEAQLAKADADATLTARIASLVERQFSISLAYEQVARENAEAIGRYSRGEQDLADALGMARRTRASRDETLGLLLAARAQRDAVNQARADILNAYSPD